MSYIPQVPCCEHPLGHPARASGVRVAERTASDTVFIVESEKEREMQTSTSLPSLHSIGSQSSCIPEWRFPKRCSSTPDISQAIDGYACAVSERVRQRHCSWLAGNGIPVSRDIRRPVPAHMASERWAQKTSRDNPRLNKGKKLRLLPLTPAFTQFTGSAGVGAANVDAPYMNLNSKGLPYQKTF